MITAAKRLNSQSYEIFFNPSEYEKFSSTFPFIETDDQAKTIEDVISDFSRSFVFLSTDIVLVRMSIFF